MRKRLGHPWRLAPLLLALLLCGTPICGQGRKTPTTSHDIRVSRPELRVSNSEELSLWNPWNRDPAKNSPPGAAANLTALVALPAVAAARATPLWFLRLFILTGVRWWLPAPAFRTVELAYVAAALLTAKSPAHFAQREVYSLARSPSLHVSLAEKLLRRLRFRFWRRLAVRAQLLRFSTRLRLRRLSPFKPSRSAASLRWFAAGAAADAARLQGLYPAAFAHAAFIVEGCRLPYVPAMPDSQPAATATAATAAVFVGRSLTGNTPWQHHRTLGRRALRRFAREVDAAFGGVVAVADEDNEIVAPWRPRRRFLIGPRLGWRSSAATAAGPAAAEPLRRRSPFWSRLRGLARGFRRRGGLEGSMVRISGGNGGVFGSHLPQSLLLTDVVAVPRSRGSPMSLFRTFNAVLVAPGGVRRAPVTITLPDRRQQRLARDDGAFLRRKFGGRIGLFGGGGGGRLAEMDLSGVLAEVEACVAAAADLAGLAEATEAVRAALRRGGLLGNDVVVARIAAAATVAALPAPRAGAAGKVELGTVLDTAVVTPAVTTQVLASPGALITSSLRRVPLWAKYALEHAVMHKLGERHAFLRRVARVFAHLILVEGIWPSAPRPEALLYMNDGQLGLPAPLAPVSALAPAARRRLCRLYIELDRTVRNADSRSGGGMGGDGSSEVTGRGLSGASDGGAESARGSGGGAVNAGDEERLRTALAAAGLALDLPPSPFEAAAAAVVAAAAGTSGAAGATAVAAAAAAAPLTHVMVARALLDTGIAGLPPYVLDPLHPSAALRRVGVKRLPEELSPVLRTIAILRGLCAYLDVDTSMLHEFASAARRGLASDGAPEAAVLAAAAATES